MYKLLLLITLATTFMGCQGKKECCKEDTEKTIHSESGTSESVYLLDSDWLTQDGKDIKLASLQGKVVVAAMVFTHCESACPRIVADMQHIEKAVGNSPDVVYLLISMDPERDTPKRFMEFGKERQLGEHWTMISSNQDNTDEIANVLGMKIKKLSDGGFDHSNAIYLLDKKGNIAFVQEGLNQNADQIIEKIKSKL